MIRIFTRNADEFGVLQFESSNPKSQVAVDKVKEILKGDFGIQNTNCFVGIKDGYLVWKEWSVRIDPDVEVLMIMFERFLKCWCDDVTEFEEYINKINNDEFEEDVASFILSKLKTKKDIEKFMIKKDHKIKILKGSDIKDGAASTSLIINFMLKIYYALKIYNCEEDKIKSFLKAVSKGFGDAFNQKFNQIWAKDDEDKTEDDLFFEAAYFDKTEIISNFYDLMEGNIIKTMLHPGDIHSVEKHSPEYGDYLESVCENEFKDNFKTYIKNEIYGKDGGDEKICQKFFSNDQINNNGVRHIVIGINSNFDIDILDSIHESNHLISYALARLLQVYYTMKIRKVDSLKIDRFAENMKDIITAVLKEKESDANINTKSSNVFEQFDDIRNNKPLRFE